MDRQTTCIAVEKVDLPLGQNNVGALFDQRNPWGQDTGILLKSKACAYLKGYTISRGLWLPANHALTNTKVHKTQSFLVKSLFA